MNKYEIAVLYDPDLEVDLAKAEARVKKIVEDGGGKISATDNWGKRKLAYHIKGHESAIYVFYETQLSPSVVRSIEAALNITSEVIRFLIVRPDLKKQAKADAERADKAQRNAERASLDKGAGGERESGVE